MGMKRAAAEAKQREREKEDLDQLSDSEKRAKGLEELERRDMRARWPTAKAEMPMSIQRIALSKPVNLISKFNPLFAPKMTHKILHNAININNRVAEIAYEINRDYLGREIELVCLTNAALIFTSDLIRLLDVPIRLHTLAFTSYAKTSTSGEVRLTQDISEPLQGRHVLVIEGMVISGRTPLYLMNFLRLRQPGSLELCAIGSKPMELAVALPIKYRMFEFKKEWVMGYGIGKGPERALPYLINGQESK